MFRVDKNCFRIDKVIVDLRQFVNLNGVANFDTIKQVNGYRYNSSNNFHTISRGRMTAQVSQGGSKIYLQHGVCENGVRRLRETLGLTVEDVDDEFNVRDNFLPVEIRDQCDVFKFMTKDFPSYLEDRIETDFADFASNIGGSLRQEIGNRVVVMSKPNSQSYCLRLIEAAADILVPKNFNLKDYRFQENIAAVGWIKEPESDDPPGILRGYTHKRGVEFVIYLKDWLHPEYSQIRAELKFKKEDLKKLFGGISFVTKYSKRDKRTLFDIFESLIVNELEPFAKTVFTFHHTLTEQDRNQRLRQALQTYVRTPQGYAFERRDYEYLYEQTLSSLLTVKRSELKRTMQDAMVRQGLFKRMPQSKGLYRLDESKLLEVIS